MRKIIALAVSLMLCFAMLPGSMPAAAENLPGGNHYNVLLAVDGSGSIIWTDSQNLRFDAIRQFIGLLSEEGNSLGTIIFDEEIAVSRAVQPVSSRADKQKLMDVIERYEPDPQGDTNIGLALNEAVNMLAAGGNRDLPSVIVLFSDGNTDLEGKQATEQSLMLKADAMDRARERNIPIYTICLNEDGSANPEELGQISDATGGKSEEVTHPEDLKRVFASLYNLIYGTSTHTLIPEKTWEENGLLKADIRIPRFGVQEVNIIINGTPSEIILERPDESKVSEVDFMEMATFSKSFTLIKIVKPLPGDWTVSLYGKPGDSVSADTVFNSEYRAEFSLTQQSDVPVETEKTYTLTLYDGAEPVTEKEAYEEFSADLYVTDASGRLLDTVAMEPQKDSFSVQYSFDEIGTYYLSAAVAGQIFTQITDPVMVNAGNTAPYLKKEGVLTKRIYLLPFADTASFSVDVSKMAQDEEDESLHYKVISTAFLEDDYQMTAEGVLSMQDFSVSKGSFTIGAFDSMGAYCSFTVRIETVSVPWWMLAAGGAGLFLLLCIAGLIALRMIRKPFKGSCFAQSMSEGVYSQWSEIRKPRGRIRLSSFGIELPPGISGSAYLQASGKNYVTLISRTPFYCRGEMVRKMQITSFDVEIRASASSMDVMWIHFNRKGKSR